MKQLRIYDAPFKRLKIQAVRADMTTTNLGSLLINEALNRIESGDITLPAEEKEEPEEQEA